MAADQPQSDSPKSDSPKSDTDGSLQFGHPVPVSARSEHEILLIYNRRVREKCRSQLKGVSFFSEQRRPANTKPGFAECAKENMWLVNYTCHDLKMAMNTCLRKHGTLEERDHAREEWFAKKLGRAKEAQAKAVEAARPVEALRSVKDVPKYPEHWGRPETREGFGTSRR
jgi:COX assembly protein 1